MHICQSGVQKQDLFRKYKFEQHYHINLKDWKSPRKREYGEKLIQGLILVYANVTPEMHRKLTKKIRRVTSEGGEKLGGYNL